MGNVVYLIREMSDITLRNLLKQNLTYSSNTLCGQFLQIFAAAKESLVLIRILIIPGIAVLFLQVTSKHGKNMARARNSNENNSHFIDNLLFFKGRVNQSIKKIFLKVLQKLFLSFERWSVTIFSNFSKQILYFC